MSVSIEDFNDLKARLFALEMEVEDLKTAAITPSAAAPVPKLTPVNKIEKVDGGHVLHESRSGRSTAAKTLWLNAGNTSMPDSSIETFVSICDQIGCIAPEHRQIVSKAEARAFNTARADRALEEFGADAMLDYIAENSTRISDGHVVLNTDDGKLIPLPNGRKVGASKAVAFAYRLRSLPMTARRTCKYDGCIAKDHIESKPA